jgi:uncharacterized lipoprotein YajG
LPHLTIKIGEKTMKKIAILFSIVVSVFVLASCAAKSQPAAVSDNTVPAASHHNHDYKGEGK